MSDTAETDADSGGFDSDRLVERLKDWYHLPGLALLAIFMFWVRAQSWGNFVRDGQVYFGGNDPWYHYRQVTYAVKHGLETMPYDVWTGFSEGVHSGQFGTLFDQLIAAGALIYGLGDPTAHQIAIVTMFAPAVFGALVAIPTYLVGRRLQGRASGLLAAVILALLPGTFLRRGMVGTADHNIAEPLFMTIAVFGMLVAIAVAETEKPIWEQIRHLEVEGLRRVVGYSTLAGVATGLYLYVWPPGVLLVGIFGVYVIVKMTSDHVGGTSPEHVGIAAAVTMVVTSVMALVRLYSLGFSTTDITLLQVLVPLAVAGGALYLSWLSRTFEKREIEDQYFPAAVLGTLAIGVLGVRLLIPRLYSLVSSNLLRFVGFNAGAEMRTIGEAQPFPLQIMERTGLSASEAIFNQYGLTFFLAVTALALVLLVPLLRSGDRRRIGLAVLTAGTTGVFVAFPWVMTRIGDVIGLDGSLVGVVVIGSLLALIGVYGSHDREHLFFATWTVFLVAAAFTQLRFNYYLAVPVAILTAYLPFYLLGLIDYRMDFDALVDMEINTVVTVSLVLLLVIMPLAIPVGMTNAQGQTYTKSTAWQIGSDERPRGVVYWQDTLDWMENNTPAVGNYGGATNADQMQYYGTYAKPTDNNFDYPKGAYGVMSWWDYGHWITTIGHRIPVANPFQQHATTAANFLIAPNETASNAVLQRNDEDDAKTRYVAIDWQMVGEKFRAPTVFYDLQKNVSYYDDFVRAVYPMSQQGQLGQRFTLHKQRYYESTMVRLYEFYGSAKSPRPIVIDWNLTRTRGGGAIRTVSRQGGYLKTGFANISAARAYVQQDGSAQVGGFRGIPPERVPALEHYRLVKVNAPPATYQGSNYPPVKLFELVPGATVQGTGPANKTVVATVEMNIPSRNKTFTYRQRAETGPDGEFTMTLPYSTTGYENWGPEDGYTNVSVRANTSYQFTAGGGLNESGYFIQYSDRATVTEAQVIGENDTSVTVDLQRQVIGQLKSGGQSNDSGSTSPDGTDTGSGSQDSDATNAVDEARPADTSSKRATP
ncbi:MAG: oligosaccharyl transferase, archaeosortase A system-associated [Halorhabdus sp.]